MLEINTMQRLRFEKRSNRLDSVKTISKNDFDIWVSNGEFIKTQHFTSTNNTLQYDEERGGVFVWSNNCNQYFLVGKDTKLRNS